MLELIRLVLTHFVLFRVGLPRNLLTPLGNREVQGPLRGLDASGSLINLAPC